MEKRELRSNYILALINFVLFLIVFCFVLEYTETFLKEVKNKEGFKLWVLFLGASFPLIFYTFVSDLNTVYEKIQQFFFRYSFLNLVMPSLLILLTFGYFIIPKLTGILIDKNIFVFLGGYSFTAHLIFVAQKSKSASFSGFINYVFAFSMIYLFTLIILGVYLSLGFDLSLGRIITASVKDGLSLVKSIFIQIFP